MSKHDLLIAASTIWVVVTAVLVMFMQAGFAVVEAGLCRAKNANHTMMMNFMVYGVGMLAYFLIGFPLQMGGAGATETPIGWAIADPTGAATTPSRASGWCRPGSRSSIS